MPAEPRRVEVSLSQGVTIEWEDGHISRYAIRALRAACPCATCADLHHTGERPTAITALPIYQPTGTALEGVAPMGRYALQFHFNDGHKTGIFTWDYLRSLCSCAECRPSAPAQLASQ